MTLSRILGLLLYFLVGVLLAGLVSIEIRVWMRDRRNPLSRGPAARRLFRRGLGTALLAAILMLLKYPPPALLSPYEHLMKLLVCLLLCAGTLGVVVWDFRAIRRDMKRDADGFVEKSAQDLRQYLEEIAAKRQNGSS